MKNKVKSIYNEKDCIHYVAQSEMTRFISINLDVDWSEAFSIKRESKFFNMNEHKTYFTRDDVFNSKFYKEEKYYWVRKFFEAHSFMNKIMFVFDD